MGSKNGSSLLFPSCRVEWSKSTRPRRRLNSAIVASSRQPPPQCWCRTRRGRLKGFNARSDSLEGSGLEWSILLELLCVKTEQNRVSAPFRNHLQDSFRSVHSRKRLACVEVKSQTSLISLSRGGSCYFKKKEKKKKKKLSAVCLHDGHQDREMARATELHILPLKPLTTPAQVEQIMWLLDAWLRGSFARHTLTLMLQTLVMTLRQTPD